MPLTSYLVTVPKVGKLKVMDYSPSFAARQAQNSMLSRGERESVDSVPRYRVCWVRETGAPKRVASERVKVYNGFGR